MKYLFRLGSRVELAGGSWRSLQFSPLLQLACTHWRAGWITQETRWTRSSPWDVEKTRAYRSFFDARPGPCDQRIRTGRAYCPTRQERSPRRANNIAVFPPFYFYKRKWPPRKQDHKQDVGRRRPLATVGKSIATCFTISTTQTFHHFIADNIGNTTQRKTSSWNAFPPRFHHANFKKLQFNR